MMRKSACDSQQAFKRDNKVKSTTHKEMTNFFLRLAPLHKEHRFCGDYAQKKAFLGLTSRMA